MKNPLLIGMLFMAFGMLLIPVGDSLAKYIASVTHYSPGFLAWSRFAVGTVMILPFAVQKQAFNGLSFRFFWQQGIRGALIGATIVLIITAVTLSPIADVFGAFFIGPALSIIFSYVFLREKATALEWLAVLLGFIGVLLVVQPSGEISAGLVWALGAGVFYGAFLVATRWAAKSGPPIAQLGTQLMFGGLFLLPLAHQDLTQMVTSDSIPSALPLVVMGITSASANYFSILALARAPAAYLAPVVYLQIVAATIIGLLIFNDSLNVSAALGLGLIIITGIMRFPWPRRNLD